MGTLAGCFGMGTYIGLTVFLPVYFETVRGMSASDSGLALIPLMAGSVFGAATAGRFLAKGTRYKRVPLAGLTAAMAGCAILALFADALPLLAIEIVLACISVGLGTLLPVQTVSIQNAVALHELGTATATSNFARSLGGALLVAVFGAIVVAGAGVHGAGSAEALASRLSEGSSDFAGVFRVVFAAAMGGFALAFLALLAMEERPLRSSFAGPEGSRPK
jgi:sugar phosphate permease